MATYTQNLNLKKPATSDNAKISDLNSNMDTIDTYCKNLNDHVYGGTVPTQTDLNTVINPAFYLLSVNNVYFNLPPQQIYSMFVTRPYTTANVVFQLGIGTNYIFFRVRTSETDWDPWHKIDNFGHGWIAGCDLNTLIEPGVYGISSGQTYTNLPTGETSGILEVLPPTAASSYVVQRLTIINRFFIRYKYLTSGSAWGPWYKFEGTAV